MQVREIMVTDVKTTGPDVSLQECAKRMDSFNIGSLLVTKEERLAGIITERDILRAVAKGVDTAKTKVEEAMTKEVIMVEPDLEVSDASDIMVEKKVKKLPVIENDNLVGILTAYDIMAYQPKMAEQLSKLFSLPDKKKSIAG